MWQISNIFLSQLLLGAVAKHLRRVGTMFLSKCLAAGNTAEPPPFLLNFYCRAELSCTSLSLLP